MVPHWLGTLTSPKEYPVAYQLCTFVPGVDSKCTAHRLPDEEVQFGFWAYICAVALSGS